MSSRHYLFPEDDEPIRLTTKLVNGLISDQAHLPEFAGTRQRILSVVLDTDGTKPREIIRTEPSILEFDEEGGVRRGLHEALRLGLSSAGAPSRRGEVIDLAPSLQRKRLREQYRWEPSKADIDRIISDIWPTKKTDRLRVLKPSVPPQIPLTFEARTVLDEVSSEFSMSKLRIEMLKDRSLKSFHDEALKLSRIDPDFPFFYGALAQMAGWELSRRAQWKAGTGTWYAIVEVMAIQDGFSEAVERYVEEHQGREAAVSAARRMLVENAHKFSENRRVEAELLTLMEWQQRGYPDP